MASHGLKPTSVYRLVRVVFECTPLQNLPRSSAVGWSLTAFPPPPLILPQMNRTLRSCFPCFSISFYFLFPFTWYKITHASEQVALPLFWKSHCSTGPTACVILYHVTGSCERGMKQLQVNSVYSIVWHFYNCISSKQGKFPTFGTHLYIILIIIMITITTIGVIEWMLMRNKTVTRKFSLLYSLTLLQLYL